MPSSVGLRWSCYAKKREARSIVSGCWTCPCTWWCRHRDPLRWWCSLVDNWYQLNTPLLDVPQNQLFESPQLFLVLLYSFGLSVAAYNISCMSWISLHSSQDDQPDSNSLEIFEKIIMIEMIKTMNEISPYIGLSGTFHRLGVERPPVDMSSSVARRWSCYAKKRETWSIVSECWTYPWTWWYRNRDPLRW